MFSQVSPGQALTDYVDCADYRQSHDPEGAIMQITFVGTTSGNNGCPTLYRTERGTVVVQGTTVIDGEALAEMARHGNGIPAYESAVEIPAELLAYVDVDSLPLVALDADRPEFVVDTPAPAASAG
jgi:hypothetical protein